MNKIDENILQKLFPGREKQAKKYDHGSVLIIGGSEIYSGSPALAGLAAMRGGADIVQIIAPKRSADIVAGFGPDFITYPVEGPNLSTDHLSRLLEITASAKIVSRGKLSVVIGGGIGRKEETKELVRRYVEEVDVPITIDADGIYAFEDQGKDLLSENVVFTPHLYEFYILTGQKIDGLSLEEKVDTVTQQAAQLGATIALKGATDIISDGSETRINPVAVPELTAGGCGDTLAGLVGAMLAKGEDRLDAVSCGIYMNTAAGKLAVKEKGEALIAVDLIEKIPQLIKR